FAALGAWTAPASWTPLQQELEAGLTGTWKFFEHTWSRTGNGPTTAQLAAEKEAWTEQVETAVADVAAAGQQAFAALVATPPSEDRVAVFNPLGFTRTDVVELAVPDAGPWAVADVATNGPLPTQVVVVDGTMRLRWLASEVPSLGYRVYRYAHGTPPPSS